MRHQSVAFDQAAEVSIPRGWVILALVVVSWLAVIGLVQLALRLAGALLGT